MNMNLGTLFTKRKRIFWYWYYRMFKSHLRFEYQDVSYPYFYHPYNRTWRNERVIEVPIAWSLINQHPGKRVLEVGNVLSHYFSYEHTTVDKYEKAVGVKNVDIVSYTPEAPFDLIISLSTLEHVGWDEEPRDADKTLRAVAWMKKLLKPGGVMLISWPIGYNDDLDQHLDQGHLEFDRIDYLQRYSTDNRWKTVGYEDVRGSRYGKPFRAANALAFGWYHQPLEITNR